MTIELKHERIIYVSCYGEKFITERNFARKKVAKSVMKIK
jgi:hypothetical protein